MSAVLNSNHALTGKKKMEKAGLVLPLPIVRKTAEY